MLRTERGAQGVGENRHCKSQVDQTTHKEMKNGEEEVEEGEEEEEEEEEGEEGEEGEEVGPFSRSAIPSHILSIRLMTNK